MRKLVFIAYISLIGCSNRVESYQMVKCDLTASCGWTGFWSTTQKECLSMAATIINTANKMDPKDKLPSYVLGCTQVIRHE